MYQGFFKSIFNARFPGLVLAMAAACCLQGPQAFAQVTTATVGRFTPNSGSTVWTTNAGGFLDSTTVQNDVILKTSTNNLLYGTGVTGGSIASWVSTTGGASDNLAAVWWQTSNGLTRMTSWDLNSSSTAIEPQPMAAAYFPYTLGAKSAVMQSATVLNGNVAGITVTRPTGDAGAYRVSGLSEAPSGRTGLLMPFLNGTPDTGAISGGVLLSTQRTGTGSWDVLGYNIAGSASANINDWSWLYVPGDAEGVLAFSVSAGGTLTPLTDESATYSTTGQSSSGFYEFKIGDGTTVNPTTYALFLAGNGSDTGATDNTFTWTPNGTTAYGPNSFGVYSSDQPGEAADSVSYYVLAVPYSGVVVVPEPSTYAMLIAGGLAMGGAAMRRRRLVLG